MTDTTASIARELVEAIDALEITGDPPTVDDLSRKYLLAAIKKIDGPLVDADAKLQMMLNALVKMADALRGKSR